MSPMKKSVLAIGIIASLFSSVVCAANNEVFAADESGDSSNYQKGQKAMDKGDWKKASKYFREMVNNNSKHSDAALYWKAYSEQRSGKTVAANRSLKKLFRNYKDSEWLSEAKTLQSKMLGVANNSEMKEYALHSLLNVSPEKALPLLKKILAGNNTNNIKEMALFVLSQMGTAESFKIIENLALDNSNRDIQENAIQMLAMSGFSQSQNILAKIYADTTDISIKEAILSGFMIAGASDKLLSVVKTETNPDLKGLVIVLLSQMGFSQELLSLYKNESSQVVKESIISAMMMSKNVAGITYIIENEDNADLLATAIQMLSMMGVKESSEILSSLWDKRNNPEVHDAIMESWMVKRDSKALLNVANTSELIHERTQAIEYLGVMRATLELRELYKTEKNVKVKKQLVESLLMAGDSEILSEILAKEKDEKVLTNTISLAAAFNQKGVMDKLNSTYQSTDSIIVKKAIIEAWMIRRNSDNLIRAAKSEKNPILVENAIEMLAVMGKTDSLKDLYNSNLSKRAKKSIIESYMISRDSNGLIVLLNKEKDRDLQESVIEMLGIMKDKASTKALSDFYKQSDDIKLKTTIIESFMIQGRAKKLVELFRTETNTHLKREAVKNLSMMNSPEAQDLMLELLEQD